MKKSELEHVHAAIASMQGRPVTPSPFSAAADREATAWAASFELVRGAFALRRVADIRCGSCAGHTYPHASREIVILGAKLITWLFLFDDRYGEGRDATDMRDLMSTVSSFARVARGGALPPAPTPFHRALADLRADAAAAAQSDVWLERFAESLDRYFDGCVLEYQHRRDGSTPSLLQYRRLRAWSIGTFPVFDLIELTAAGRLGEDDATDPAILSLRERAALLCAWVNDIYSFSKERDDGDSLNLVSVLRKEYGLSDADAFGAAAEVFNVDLALFREERENMPLSAAAARYTAGLEDWIYGNLAWTGRSYRYITGSRTASSA